MVQFLRLREHLLADVGGAFRDFGVRRVVPEVEGDAAVLGRVEPREVGRVGGAVGTAADAGAALEQAPGLHVVGVVVGGAHPRLDVRTRHLEGGAEHLREVGGGKVRDGEVGRPLNGVDVDVVVDGVVLLLVRATGSSVALGRLPEGAGVFGVVVVVASQILLGEALEAGVDDGERGLEPGVAGVDAVDEGLVVERLTEGLASALVAPLAAVEAEDGPAAGGRALHSHVLVALEPFRLKGVNGAVGIEVAAFEEGPGGDVVGDDADVVLVDVGTVLHEPVIGVGVGVVVRVADEVRALGAALGEDVGPGGHAAHMLLARLVGLRQHKLLVDDAEVLAGAVDKRIGARPRPVLLDVGRVDRVDAVEVVVGAGGHVGGAQRGQQPRGPLDGEGDILAGDGVAVVELHPLAHGPDEGALVHLLIADGAIHGEGALAHLEVEQVVVDLVHNFLVVGVEDGGVHPHVFGALPGAVGAATRGAGRRSLGGGFGGSLGGRFGGGGRGGRRVVVVVIVVAAAGEDGGGAGSGYPCASQESSAACLSPLEPEPVVIAIAHHFLLAPSVTGSVLMDAPGTIRCAGIAKQTGRRAKFAARKG